MKTIILLILSAFTAFAATTYPVLTDNANRTFSGGATNLALLNTNQTWTGTPTFPAGVFPANNISRRILWSTNGLFFNSLIVNAAADRTNSGDYSTITQGFKVTVPALLSSNSIVTVYYHAQPTNLNAGVATMWVYAGDNTNYINSTVAQQAGNYAPTILAFTLLKNYGSWTNQAQLNVTDGARYNYVPNFKVDTSVPWQFYMGFTTANAAGFTNLNTYNISLEEQILP